MTDPAEQPGSDIFVGEITGVGTASGGYVPHAWKEKTLNPSGLGVVDNPLGRTGTVTDRPLVTLTGLRLNVGDLVFMRLRGWTPGTKLLYESVTLPHDICCPGHLGGIDGDGCCDHIDPPPDDPPPPPPSSRCCETWVWTKVTNPVGDVGYSLVRFRYCVDGNGNVTSENLEIDGTPPTSPPAGFVLVWSGLSGVLVAEIWADNPDCYCKFQPCTEGGTPGETPRPPKAMASGGCVGCGGATGPTASPMMFAAGGSDCGCHDENAALDAVDADGIDGASLLEWSLYQVNSGLPALPSNNTFTGENTFTDTVATEQATLGNPVLTLSSVATNDNPTATIYQNRVATTNNALTTLHTLALADETLYALWVEVIGRRTGGAAGSAGSSAHYIYADTFKRTGGGGAARVVAAAPTTVLARKDNLAVDCQINASGNNVLIQVQGDTSNNYSWHLVELKVSPLSS